MREEYNLKYITKHLSKKFKATLFTGAFVLVGSGISFLSGCGKTNFDKEETKTEIEATTDAMITEIPNAKVLDEKEEAEEKEIVDDNQKYYDEVAEIEQNVTDFINDGMAKGLFNYDVDDSMKESIARLYLNYYLMMNRNEISGKAIEIMNQEKDMNSIDMINDSMVAEQSIQEQTIISDESTILDYSKLIKNENDLKIINKLANIIASMHTAIKNNDADKLESLRLEAVEIKEGLISKNTEYTMSYSPMAIDLVLNLLDVTDSLTNGGVISDEDDRLQFYNTLYVNCLDGEYVSNMTEEEVINMATLFGIDYKNMSKEQILEEISKKIASNASGKSLRSIMRTQSEDAMKLTLEGTVYSNYSEEYYYKNVIKEIASRINLSLHVKPEVSSIEFENSNPYGPNFYKGEAKATGSTSTVYVDEIEVPEAARVPEYVTIKDVETGKEIKGLSEAEIVEANNRGDAQATADFKAGIRNSNPSIGGKSGEWNEIYRNSYNATYNGFEAAKKQYEQEPATEYFEEIKDSKEEITSEQTETLIKTEQKTEVKTEVKTETKTEKEEVKQEETKQEEIKVEPQKEEKPAEKQEAPQAEEKPAKIEYNVKPADNVISEDQVDNIKEEGIYFVPANGEEEIIEEDVQDVEPEVSSINYRISSLKALKQQLVGMYVNAYNPEKVNVKRG